MNTNGYEILNPVNSGIDVPDVYDVNIGQCNCGDVNAGGCPDIGCSCPVDAGCSCGVNEMDCSYRMGNR